MSQTTNIEGLQAILETVNALPEAGSGSGSAIETCSFHNSGWEMIEEYFLNVLNSNGEITVRNYSDMTIDGAPNWTQDNCICGSIVVIKGAYVPSFVNKLCLGCEELMTYTISERNTGTIFLIAVLRLTCAPGETAIYCEKI